MILINITKIGNDSRICVSRHAKKDACRQPPVSRAKYIKFNFVGDFKRKYKDKKTLSSVKRDSTENFAVS